MTVLLHRRRRRRPAEGWWVVALSAVFPVFEIIREAIGRRPVLIDGDQALIELGARRAWLLDQLVGVYSRYGFHEPGPVALYLLAPFVRLFEPYGPGAYAGAVVINGAALMVVALVVQRWAGTAAAYWTVAASALFVATVGVDTFRQPWNPYLIVAPTAAFGLLVAGSAAGRSGVWAWATVVGSFVIQTHMATVLPVAALLVLSGGLVLFRRLRGGSPAGSRRRLYLPAGLLVLMWLPSLVELAADQPNNVSALWKFYRSPPAGPSLGSAARTWLDDVVAMPVGNSLNAHHAQWQVALSAVGIGLCWVGTAWLSTRRREGYGAVITAVAVLMAVFGLVALSDAPGPSMPYFGTWLAAVPLLSLVGLGSALFRPVATRADGGALAAAAPSTDTARRRPAGSVTAPRPTVRGRAGLVLAAVAVVATVTLLVADLRTPAVASEATPNARTGYAMAQVVTASGVPSHSTVALEIRAGAAWPATAGLVLDLDRQHIASTVSPRFWTLLFGHERAAGPSVVAAFALDTDQGYAADPSRGQKLADIDGLVLLRVSSPADR